MTLALSLLIASAGSTPSLISSPSCRPSHFQLSAFNFQPIGAHRLNVTKSEGSKDEAYTKKILEYTTEKFFLTELVDHLPASATVPTPEKVLGYVIGTPKVLTSSVDCARYLRELEKASPRVKVLSLGKSEEGREMVVALVSDEANLARLDRLKEITARLGDPRKFAAQPATPASGSTVPSSLRPYELLSDTEADALIKEGVPFYWATGGLHSPESGPPEMLLELAYRLAVEETPFIEAIRKNAVVMITPVLETDGRDRVVDINKWRQANPGKQQPPLVYWGHYVAHDNNRDGIGQSLALSRNLMKTWLDFRPQVMHDLHESVPYLYISTGTGPYNAWLDPITINEWQILAYNEINEMTKRGVPGVWTHDFYDGWSPNYAFYAANGHNAIGRFYETFGGGYADTGIRNVGRQTERAWFRPNPPYPSVRWSIRNNVNIMQSALLLGLNKVATEKVLFLKNYYLKSKRSVAKARTEGPAAWMLPGDQTRKGNVAWLLGLLFAQGIEVHRLSQRVETADGKFPEGSWVVRMDQPYSRMADMVLDSQYYNPTDPRSYDDTGWQLGPLFHVSTVRCKDAKILDAPMRPVPPAGEYSVTVSSPPGVRPVAFVIRNRADIGIVRLKAAMPKVELSVAEADFANREAAPTSPLVGEVGERSEPGGGPQLRKAQGESASKLAHSQTGAQTTAQGAKYPTGTLIARFPDDSAADAERQKLAQQFGLDMVPFDPIGEAKYRPLAWPRFALVHTWTSTQDDGWFRIAFDQLKVPYEYISVHEIRDTANLKEKYDVIVLTQARGSAQSLVNGMPKDGDPIPWKASEAYPNFGGPASTDDVRGGIELAGMVNLQKFVQDGGLLICAGNWSRVPIDYGLVSGVSYVQQPTLNAPGGVFLTENAAKDSPVLNGYDDKVGVYFNANSCPILQVGGGPGGPGGGGRGPTSPPSPTGATTQTRASGRGSKTDPDVIQGRPPYTPKREEGDQPEFQVPQGSAANRPKVLLRFASAESVLVSGMADKPEELAGKAALVDCPSGKGHILLFGFNPMWRGETVGSYMLIFNAAMSWDRLAVPTPAPPRPDAPE